MNLNDRLRALEHRPEEPEATKARPPQPGWEPGVVWHGASGEITTAALTGPPGDWDAILASRGLDPALYEVVGDTVLWCSWDGWTRNADGESEPAICYSFKAEIRRRRGTGDPVVPEDLYAAARKARPRKRPAPDGDATLVVALSDWQVGNRDGGGVQRQAEAIAALVDSIPQRLADLRRMGHTIGHVALLGLGDLVEGTCGFYPAQQYRVELDRRDQLKLVRRGIRDIAIATAPHTPRLTLAAIPGNHGENRQGGKNITSVNDNDDVAVFEQVAEILATNPEAFGHVGFRLARDQIALSLDLSGQVVAFTHGHVAKASGQAANTMWNWWQRQSHGRAYPGVADAEILVTGHYHHLNVKEQEGRALFICPSLTDVGEYYADSQGVRTRAGTLSLLVAPDGWGELTLL
jgi:predicted phosphodiesterase